MQLSRRGTRVRRGARVLVTLAAITAIAACGSDAAESSTPSPSASPTDIEEVAPMTDPTVPSTPEASPADDATPPLVTGPPDCRRLTDFAADDTGEWFVVNDGVMGGRSNGAIEITDSLLRFSGSVVTAGGGFTSVRLRLNGNELDETSRIEMRVRPDGRTYGLTLEDALVYRGIPVSHRADLAIGPVDSDGWAMATVTYDRLAPSVFGLPLDAPPFDPGSAREIGVIIADGTDGDFVLDIDWIDACR